MSFTKIYQGEFLDIQSKAVKVEIYDANYSGSTPTVGELSFPAEEPVVIEWSSDKTDTIIGSTCSVTIISPGDRSYLDLYTAEAGRYWLKLYRKSASYYSLIWAGSLDTEFYEEPYSRLKDYDVRLTFSDFGLLKRRTFDLPEGNQRIIDIVESALDCCTPNATYSLDSRFISSYCLKSSTLSTILDNLQVQTANFIDEDGETNSWYDVLEAVLKPLALRIEQRGGKIWLYDINALLSGNGATGTVNGYGHQSGLSVVNPQSSEEVYWTGDDSTLSVDETFNKVRVTFSPYAGSKLFDAGKCDFSPVGDYYTMYNGDNQSVGQGRYDSFEIAMAPSSTSVCGIAECNRTKFKIKSIVDGNDCQGVVGYIQPLNYDGNQVLPSDNTINDGGSVGTQPSQPTKMGGSLLYRTNRFPLVQSDGKRYMRITIPMLLDGRYNPFADETEYNTLHDYFKHRGNAIYMRVDVKVYDSQTGGNLLKYYQNWPFMTTGKATTRIIWESSYGWKDASTSQTVPSLTEWCKFDNDKLHHTDCGTLGSLNNNHEAFNTSRNCTNLFVDMEGMHVPFPTNVDGSVWCEIAVYDELYIYDEDDTFNSNLAIGGYGGSVYGQIKWWLIGFPTVEVVRWEHEQFQDYDVDDIEESGYINTLAKEELNVDTICGTIDEPAARGAYLVANRNVLKMQRANRLTSVEQLLIGTIYSQYATRHLKLEGSVRTVAPYSGPLLFTDANIESSKKFLITNETFNVIDCESEATLVEVSPDNYTSS